jgi:hypothetical protein
LGEGSAAGVNHLFKDILESEFVDGVLVGGALTKIDQLEGILNSI